MARDESAFAQVIRQSRPAWRFAWATLFLCGSCSAVAAESTVELAYLESDDVLPAQIVSGEYDGRFTAVTGEVLAMDRRDGTWWRAVSRVGIPAGDHPQLSLTDAALVAAELWVPGSPAPRAFSNYSTSRDGTGSSRGLAIPLDGNVEAGTTVYLRIWSHGPTPLRVSLEDQREARRLDDRHTKLRYALLTAMGVVALLALGFAFGLGERGFGLFAAAILCQMVYLMLLGGEIRFAPPGGDIVTATMKAGRAIVGLGIASFALFVRQYLELATRQPGLARLFVICAALSFSKVVWNLFTSPDWLGVFGNWLIITLAAATLVAILRGCLRRERGALYMVVAWTPTLILATVAAAQGLGYFAGARWLQYLFAASFAYSGLVLVVGLIDRSLRVRRERIDALQEAEQRGRQLATASHDIRQPLLALRATLARLTREGALAPTVVERFRGSLEYLDRLASEYTSGSNSGEYARSAPGQEPGALEQHAGESLPVDMLVRNLELMFRDEAEAKGLELRVRSSRATVRVDAMAAMRVLSNLVANAVKYTQRGGVLIGCRRAGPCIALVIADTGPGMTAEELARVFREGERGSGAAGTDGQGLGLSIAARLSAQSGFGLRVHSVPGRGTRFTVKLPLAGQGD